MLISSILLIQCDLKMAFSSNHCLFLYKKVIMYFEYDLMFRNDHVPLHNMPNVYDVPVGIVAPSTSPFIWRSVLLYLQSKKGGCYSKSDDLSFSLKHLIIFSGFKVSTMNDSTNSSADNISSCEDVPFLKSKLVDDVPYLVAVAIIVTSGFTGNMFTVVIILCWRKLHSPTFTMIACLAVSDTLSLLSYTMYSYTNVYSLILCTDFRKTVGDFVTFVTFHTLIGLGRFNAGMQLCILACLRFRAIVYPLKFKTYCTSKAVIAMSVLGSVMVFIFFYLFCCDCCLAKVDCVCKDMCYLHSCRYY